jgi:16S rRNA processing protein RimM
VQLVVGRIGRAHGVRGEVAVEVRTDDPQTRFAAGSRLATDPPETGPLQVLASRWHSGRLLVAFEGVSDRARAQALSGTLLVVDSASCAPASTPDEFWDHDLVGLAVQDEGGADLGRVESVVHPPGADLLQVRRPDGRELFIPFVRAFVPEVDLARGLLLVALPDGLMDLNGG